MRFGILVLALVLAACGSSAADSASSSASATAPPVARCGPVQAPTLGASASGRVYQRGGVVFGCLNRTGRSVRLGQTRTCLASPRIGPVAVAGGLVAYGSQRCGVDTGGASVIVRRLSDGRVLRSLDALTLPLGVESYRSVASVVLKPDGAVAWIGVGSSIISRRRVVEVLAAGSAEQARRLDAGAGIEPRSLALRGSRVVWRDGRRVRSVALR